jgi:hypothetical protein
VSAPGAPHAPTASGPAFGTCSPSRGAALELAPPTGRRQLSSGWKTSGQRTFFCDACASLPAADPDAQRLDLADLVEFMLVTGVRIGDACALRWSTVDP